MGGKHKTAQRTKNNTKPSSSGRSAAVLNSALPQFGGISGIKNSSGFPFSTVEEFDSSINDDFQLVLKKISKKDSTTKLKGLQEFADLVQKAEPDVVKAILPAWPRFYNFLATDADNRIREATHNVHHAIVLKVKRNIAPYLKQIMAPWFTSQYDNYPPAATAAVQAFKDTFSPAKFQDAIIFCQDEILSYIYDNLIVQTAQTIAGKQATPEEADAKYERVLISCLQGYSLYLEKVPSEQIEAAAEWNSKLVSNNAFWKLPKSKLGLVRSAWFQVISAMCQKAIDLLKGRESQVLTVVLNSLDDGEPTVLPHVWECMLVAVSLIQEWWKYINIDKFFIPKLMKVLKQGGQGHAVIIYPSLLPLISQLPPVVGTNPLQFYSSFFENLRCGLKLKLVVSSRSETAAISTAFIECLQYIIIKNSSDSHLCKSLLKHQLLSTIEWCLIDATAPHKTIFTQTSLFIQHLGDHNQTSLSFFFENLRDLFSQLLSHPPDGNALNVIPISEKQIEFLHCLKVRKSKKYSKVKFGSDSEGKVGKSDDEITECKAEYLVALNKVVVKICQDYVELIERKRSKELVQQLSSLVMDFDRRQFFESLMENIKVKNPDARLMDIYEDLLKKWLHCEGLCSKTIVDLIFMLLIYLDKEERKTILKELIQIDHPDCLTWCLSEALSFPYVEMPEVRVWLQQEKIGNFFLSIVEKHIHNECPPELGVIFKLALTEDKNGELFVTRDILTEIIEKISTVLLNQTDAILNLDSCSSLAAYLCTIIYTENLLLTYGDKLLLTLLELSCKVGIENELMSSETITEINSAWQDALTILLVNLKHEDRQALIEKFTNIIEKQFNSENIRNKEYIEHLTSIFTNFLRVSYKCLPCSLASLLDGLFGQSSSKNRGETVSDLCKIAEYIKGNLGSPYEEISMKRALTELDILRHFTWSFVKYDVLCSDIEETEIFDDEEDEDSDDSLDSDKKITFLSVIGDEEDLFLEALYEYTVGESFLMNFNNVKYYNEILLYNTLLEAKLQETLNFFDETTLNKARVKLEEKSLRLGWFWCVAAYNFPKKFLKNDDISASHDERIINLNSVEEKRIGAFHMNQISKQEEDYAEIPVELLNTKLLKAFEVLDTLKKESISDFQYSDPNNLTWEKAERIIEAVRMCSNIVRSPSLIQKDWDFIVVSLVTWTSNCLKAKNLLKTFQYHSMIVSVGDLFINVCKRISEFKTQEENMNYVNEWEDILLESVHADLALLWLYLTEQLSSDSEMSLHNLPLLQNFAKVTEHLNCELIFKINDTLPKWTKFFKKSCNLLTNSNTVLQLYGYRMLLILVPGLIKIDTESVNTNSPHQKGLIFEQFEKKLTEVEEVVNNMLIEFKIGEDTCRVEPSYDSFTYTLAYLLLWDVMLTLYESSSTELRYQYAEWLKNSDLLMNLLPNLLRLMPLEVLHYSEGKSKSLLAFFLKNPVDSTCYTQSCDSETIEQMVCYLYKSSLAHFPALVRQWWTNLDTRVSQIVDKITTFYVSPCLCMEELNDVMHHQTKFKNMTVKVIPSIREILAIYTIDEAQMELTIALPPNYPLLGPDINCNRQISGTTHKQWLLQFKKCVLHQNGRIWDGLSLWNNNLDKKFDGIEECYICYAVLHPGTYQLPKLSCQTCKKKFHSVCLYKWFSTSNKSSCPICRNLF